jgi:hypothetical protein
VVRAAVERDVRDALSGHDVEFRYDYSVRDPNREPGGVVIGAESRGSRDTLREAGARGRAANDEAMRRVDVTVDLSSFTDTTVFTDLEDKHRVSAATRDWSIQIGMGATLQVGAGVSYFKFKLTNGLTKKSMDGHGYVSKGGLAITSNKAAATALATGVSVSWGDPEPFRTREPANFSDFDYRSVYIRSHSLSLAIIGYEIAKLTIFRLPGGDVWGIDIGGWTSGKAGIDLASLGYGLMWLEGDPRPYNSYLKKSERSETSEYQSSASESHRHAVRFETGKATIDAAQAAALKEYVGKSVANYESSDWRGGLVPPGP